MAIHKIKTTVNATVVADKSHDTWLVTDSGRVDAIGVGINADGPQKGREIIVEGEVYGTSWGITFGDMTAEGGGRVLVEKGGIVGSVNGAILSRGNDQQVVNHGTIGGAEGIHSMGKRLEVINTGTFDASDAGVYIDSGSARIVNNGDMFGAAAVRADEAGAGRVVVVNNGLMDTTEFSLSLLSDAGHVIRNRGEITSSIHGGDGRDRFINDGGTVGGTVDLRGGNDLYIVDRTNIDIAEGSNDGYDTVKSSADFTLYYAIEKLVLTGKKDVDGAGGGDDNTIIGNAGNNRLDGDGGNDILKGGAGADVFIFKYHGGQDEILDFQAGQDQVDLSDFSGLGIDSFADIKAASANKGGDLLITIGSEELLIHDYSRSDLHKADFII